VSPTLQAVHKIIHGGRNSASSFAELRPLSLYLGRRRVLIYRKSHSSSDWELTDRAIIVEVRFSRHILLDPVGVALAIVHWVVVVYAILGDLPQEVMSIPGGYPHTTYLWHYLVVLNLPALVVAAGLSGPFSFVSGLDSQYVHSVLGIVFVTLQWQIIGWICTLAVRDFRERHADLRISPG
jgi:hypothetical protein